MKAFVMLIEMDPVCCNDTNHNIWHTTNTPLTLLHSHPCHFGCTGRKWFSEKYNFWHFLLFVGLHFQALEAGYDTFLWALRKGMGG